jgi:hypothetical protein
MTTAIERDEFLELLLADDEFVRAEFAAIVDGFHDDDPPTPSRPAPPPCRPPRTRRRIRGPRHRPHKPGRARQRSPPLALAPAQ